jgi:uncharacterized Zn finger protein
MMPCDVCSPTEQRPGSLLGGPDGKMLRGLKQVGKTRMAGTAGERHYRCQECGLLYRMIFDAQMKASKTELVKEGDHG